MMKSDRITAARQVIVHGDCWPVTTAVAHLVKSTLPDCDCEATYTLPLLLQQLSRQPEASLVLCLRPREHIFLFYALKNALLYHPALVISDELFFSDRLVLHSWGDIPAILHGELTTAVARRRRHDTGGLSEGRFADFLSAPAPVTGRFTVPLIFTTQKRLMNYMALLMYRASVSSGVSPAQLRLLREVHRSRGKLSGLSARLASKEKQIWQDKYRLLVKLGMRNRMRELLFGTRFCESVQRTPFRVPEKTEQRHNIPDSGLMLSEKC
ncbi:transcriptional regulator [Salmonella enterica subsp. diarizonae]|nr:transcriptional regulator [Salmonella enterica subsp. diarizonae]